MEKEQFIEEMKKHNYSDEEIEDMLKTVEKSREDGLILNYEDILLEKAEEN